ncbi:acylphosphatase [Ramlibacter humi]|uniref:acylphosphatase n=1 Tax=Ramlibacter humi TaxID=2530451 RepID=A0A4Z0BHX4_9BURK|nr:acylphosphatase [Ramlibacter humi]TFY97724.1 acylphosphatase [Ramlibacter humi]
MSAAETSATRLVRVHGLVQGVGYRWACVQHARALGLLGWVRNRGDGTVEALLQGPASHVEQMCAWMRDEVPSAQVDQLEVLDAPPVPHLDGFEQRPTI